MSKLPFVGPETAFQGLFPHSNKACALQVTRDSPFCAQLHLASHHGTNFHKPNHGHAKPWIYHEWSCVQISKSLGTLWIGISCDCAHSALHWAAKFWLALTASLVDHTQREVVFGVHESMPQHVNASMVWPTLAEIASMWVTITKEKDGEKCAPSFCSALCGQLHWHFFVILTTYNTNHHPKWSSGSK